MDDNIDTSHPIFDAFRAVGYPPEALIDPGNFTAEMAEEGGARVIRWNSVGIEMFDIDGSDVVDTGRGEPYNTAIEYLDRVQQPIGFGDEAGPLNEDLPEMDRLRTGTRPDVTFFAIGDPHHVDFGTDHRAAVAALGMWGHKGHVPRNAAQAMLDAFDGGMIKASAFKDDPHAKGVQLVRAPFLARSLVGATDRDIKSSDSDVNGHDKRARQTFYRNLETLQDIVGIDE